MSGRPPAHLVVPGTERHGVTRLARQLAGACGAALVGDDAVAVLPRVHAHVTDRLFGASPEQAAERLVGLGRRTRLTVTLHDVPQPTDGAGFARRVACYAAVLGVAAGWATSSETERRTVVRHCAPGDDGAVLPLPVGPDAAHRADRWVWRPPAAGLDPARATVAVFGWVYPGKGHADAIRAVALLGSSPDRRPRVRALGAVSPGHADLPGRLHRLAADVGVRLDVTGWLEESDADRALAGSTVGVVGHGNVSASGSLHSWLAVGHRPLVRDGDYARELDALRPGTLERYDADGGPPVLARHIAARLAEPDRGRTAIAPDDLRPRLADVAAAYLAWWAR